MSTDHSPMSLDDHIEPDDCTPAKDTDGVPYCRKHHCRMTYASGGKKTTGTAYYKCPVPKCDEKAQKIKTVREQVVPKHPLACPRCSKPNKPVYCERDPNSSTAASVILRCPSCLWKSNAMAVPQLAAAYFARRPSAPIENIGDR